jgi:hypothetical protein
MSILDVLLNHHLKQVLEPDTEQKQNKNVLSHSRQANG